jgi:hypothetical protein
VICPPAPLRRNAFFAGIFLVLSALSGGCKENLSTPPTSIGQDTAGPALLFSPARDTLADSTGIFLVHLTASDRSGIKDVDFFVLPATSSFGTLTPLDTVFDTYYSVPLAQHKHGSFRFYARATDLLDHETVTDTVTVTVR